ncbi:MAG: hypothetical protein J6Y59_06830 [Bacteroidaceae bacterium]|nr:hypothetical protein [Bacteroidaceae bacterium]
MKRYFWSLLAFAMVAMLSVSLSSCKDDDGIEDDATILGEWVHHDGVGEADVLIFTGALTQGNVTYTEFDDDDAPETLVSTFTFNPKTGVLKVPGFTYRDVIVKTLTATKLKLKYFPDDDETTTFGRR